MLEALGNVVNVLLMILGFSLVIFVHELGHFLAARWAGVRAPAFAIGFGKAICSWRKGFGFRWGSGEQEYARLLTRSGQSPLTGTVQGISPTEYRLNWIPFGGYVRMLGQDDGDPGHRSDHAESYNNKPVWKRMIIISAGVAMNLALSAVLFVVVFLAGMPRIAPIVGPVDPGSAEEAAGVRTGDVIAGVNGTELRTFDDQMIEVAMTRRGRPVTLELLRTGEDGRARTEEATLTPEADEESGMRMLSLWPAPAAEVVELGDRATPEERERFDRVARSAGLEGLRPASTLVKVNEREVTPTRISAPSKEGAVPTALLLLEEAERSGGEPFIVTLRDENGAEYQLTAAPQPRLPTATKKLEGSDFLVEHALGLAPVLTVADVAEQGVRQGLRAGDVFVRLGAIVWPGEFDGIAEVRRHKGRTIAVTVLRDGDQIELECKVDNTGRIGFGPGTTAATQTLLSGAAPAGDETSDGEEPRTSDVLPGSRLVRVGGREVDSLYQAQRAALAATADAARRGEGANLEIEIALPDELSQKALAAGASPVRSSVLTLSADEVKALHALGWQLAGAELVFKTVEFTLQAGSAGQAVGMGVRETRRVLLLTYLTFVRLIDGSVRADQMKGPVGITHVGSRYAAEGLIHLLFFLALVSANLAVVNFLPIPITDGGHMIFLLVEAITRRPVSVAVQNAATLVGLVLIGCVFLFVTFNDLAGLLK